jgi:hypothetical protein
MTRVNVVAGALALTVISGSMVRAASTGRRPDDRSKVRLLPAQPPIDSIALEAAALRVRNVRLVAADPIGDVPSLNVKFEVRNEGTSPLTEIIVEIRVLDRLSADGADRDPAATIAGPFTIRGRAILDPGFSMNYEMRLRNLTPDCGCRASVSVNSARVADRPPTRR